jgi:hypothetical protein
MNLFFGGDGRVLSAPEDVIPLLAKKEKQWRERRSAYETAYSWFDAQDVPSAIRSLLETDPVFSSAVLLKAVFEQQTALDNLGRPSQTDVLAYLQIPSGQALLAVEAKVDETFGPLVGKWDDGTPGKDKRLHGLLLRLGLDRTAVSTLRYQLRCSSSGSVV